jgi:uncharacterized membrane protein
MGPISAHVEVDAPRERAFDFVGDLANRPAFMDHFVSGFHLLELESAGAGAGARFRFDVAPQALWFDTSIESTVLPQRISERGRGGRFNRIPCATEWEFIPGPGSLTTVRVAFWTEPGHPLDRAKEIFGAASFWHERNWKIALRRLRDLLEAGEPPSSRVAVAGGSRHRTGVP